MIPWWTVIPVAWVAAVCGYELCAIMLAGKLADIEAEREHERRSSESRLRSVVRC